jgi:RHS repeat-associated protein
MQNYDTHIGLLCPVHPGETRPIGIPAGRLQTITRANGADTTITYDSAGRIDDLRTAVGGSDVLGFDYTVNRAGQRTQVVETISGVDRTSSYGYDGLGRLTSAVEDLGNTFSYGYDRVGNRVSETANGATQSHTYNAANQRNGWSYDAAGNLLSDGHGDAYSYDALNRLTSTHNGAISYAYNGDGVLVRETAGGSTTHYAQDLAAPLSQVLSDGTSTYLYGMDRLATVNAAGRTWHLHDALGSVRMTLDDSGVPVSASGQSYSPFGVPQSGAMPAPFGFTGELHSNDLVYLRARWYDAGAGVFTSRDAWEGCLRTPYSLHPYQYGYSNPLSNTDPTGHCSIILASFRVYNNPAEFIPHHHADIILTEDECWSEQPATCSVHKIGGEPEQQLDSVALTLSDITFWLRDLYHNLQPIDQALLIALLLPLGTDIACEIASKPPLPGETSVMGRLRVSDVTTRQIETVGPHFDVGIDMSPWKRAFNDFNYISPPVGVWTDDKPCNVHTDRLAGVGGRIEAAQLPYNPLFRNSNAAAYTLLRNSNLPTPNRSALPQLLPGYGHNVFGPLTFPITDFVRTLIGQLEDR